MSETILRKKAVAPRRTITATEALQIANTTRQTLLTWCLQYEVDGKPLAKKVGGRWYVFPEQLQRFLEGQGKKKSGV